MNTTQATLPAAGQRVELRLGKDAQGYAWVQPLSGTVVSISAHPHPEKGHTIYVRWDSGRSGAFFPKTSDWKVI